jgi:hypothetical protein
MEETERMEVAVAEPLVVLLLYLQQPVTEVLMLFGQILLM